MWSQSASKLIERGPCSCMTTVQYSKHCICWLRALGASPALVHMACSRIVFCLQLDWSWQQGQDASNQQHQLPQLPHCLSLVSLGAAEKFDSLFVSVQLWQSFVCSSFAASATVDGSQLVPTRYLAFCCSLPHLQRLAASGRVLCTRRPRVCSAADCQPSQTQTGSDS